MDGLIKPVPPIAIGHKKGHWLKESLILGGSLFPVTTSNNQYNYVSHQLTLIIDISEKKVFSGRLLRARTGPYGWPKIVKIVKIMISERDTRL
jgi:hypothetical protein